MSDDEQLDGTEVLPLERTVSPDTLAALSGMSRKELERLSGRVQDRWYDLWVGDAEPPALDQKVISETRAALAGFDDGAPFFDVTSETPVFDAVAERLDPVWSVDSRAAEELYLSLWLGVGELATRTRRSWLSRFRNAMGRPDRA